MSQGNLFSMLLLRGEAQWQPGVGQGNGKCLMANFLTRLPAATGALLAIATIPLHAYLEDASGTILCHTFSRNWRDLCRIWPTNWHCARIRNRLIAL